MDKFTQLQSIAAPLPRSNVDTDLIIPQKFLKTIKRTGLGQHVFLPLRFHTDGSEQDDFVLNQPAFRNAKILLVGDNFGCGSSREHAAWALKDFGIRCIIAPGFADIFRANCFRNGMLPIELPGALLATMMDEALPGSSVKVDLKAQRITRANGECVDFSIDPFHRRCLLQGLDEISLTLQKEHLIGEFEARQARSQPWLYP